MPAETESRQGQVETLTGLEAARYVWSHLWRPNDESHVKLNVLDAITFSTSPTIYPSAAGSASNTSSSSSSSANGAAGDGNSPSSKAATNTQLSLSMKSWLFTATDGLIKQKTKGRWKSDSVIERCSMGDETENGTLRGHWARQGLKKTTWKEATAKDITRLCTTLNDAVLVSYGNLLYTQKIVFVEETYTAVDHFSKPGDLFSISNAKYQTQLLCGSQAKGVISKENKASSSKTGDSNEEDNVFPPHRILCVNKETNEQCRLYLIDLIKALEQRSRGKVLKLVAFLVLENDLTAGPVDGGLGGQKVWLHHVKEVSMRLPLSSAGDMKGISSSASTLGYAPSNMGSVTRSSVKGGEDTDMSVTLIESLLWEVLK